MILTPLEAVVGALMNALTRHFEYEADTFALGLRERVAKTSPDMPVAALAGMDDMGARLGRALVTLHVKNLSTVWVDWLCVLSCS
jgi:STE24 endopeptidase